MAETQKRLVILESPYAGNIFQRWLNRRYARACVRHSLMCDEAPMASHLLYTQRGILRDHIPYERKMGIEAGLEWRKVASAAVVYVDRGISSGMAAAIAAHRESNIPVIYRTLKNIPEAPA